MSQATIKTAAGPVRTQTSCRYVLVGWRRTGTGPTKPYIAKRSDSLETIRKVRKTKGYAAIEAWAIFDTTTKEEVQ